MSVTLKLGQIILRRRVLRFGTSHTVLDPKEFLQLLTSYSLWFREELGIELEP